MINFGFYETGSKNYFNCYLLTLINEIYYIYAYMIHGLSIYTHIIYMGMKAEMTLGRKLVAEGEAREGRYVGIMVRVDDASE